MYMFIAITITIISFLQFACNIKLAVACREIMLLDPYDTDPFSMMMMGPGDRWSPH